MTATNTTAAELAVFFGRYVSVPHAGCEYLALITDARKAFGRTDLLIVPVAGKGQRWIDRTSVTLKPENFKPGA